MATATAVMVPTNTYSVPSNTKPSDRVPRSQRRGLRRKKNREVNHVQPQRNDSSRSLCSVQSTESGISTDSRYRRKTSTSSVDLNILVRNNSNVVPDVVEPGRQASSRSLRSCASSSNPSIRRQGTNDSSIRSLDPSLKRQGTNDSIQSLGISSNRSGRSCGGRRNFNNSLSGLMKQGSFVVPRVEEPQSNLNSNLRRNVSDLSLTSLAEKHEAKKSHNGSQRSLGRTARGQHGSCTSLSSLARRGNNNAQAAAAPPHYNVYSLDSSDESPVLAPMTSTANLKSPPPEEEITMDGGEITIDVPFHFGGAVDEEAVDEEYDSDSDSVAAKNSVFLSLEDMTAEAAAVMDSSSCWSASGRRGGRCRTAAANPKRTEMEVSPGVYLPFRDAKETWKAVARGCTIRCCCLECGIDLVAIQDCECVVCPDCQMLNPVFDRPDGLETAPHGIGLGLKAEVVAQKVATKRRR